MYKQTTTHLNWGWSRVTRQRQSMSKLELSERVPSERGKLNLLDSYNPQTRYMLIIIFYSKGSKDNESNPELHLQSNVHAPWQSLSMTVLLVLFSQFFFLLWQLPVFMDCGWDWDMHKIITSLGTEQTKWSGSRQHKQLAFCIQPFFG